MSVREFTLINSKNQRWTLTDKSKKYFLGDPKGLGFQSNISVQQYGDVQNEVGKNFNFPQVSGVVYFYDSANATRYANYNSFVDFLSYHPLKMEYILPTSPAQTFTLDCDVTSLTKTESESNKTMQCDIVLTGLGFWKGNSFFQMATTSVSLTNNGHFPVGFTITINGTNMENPYFTLEQDNEVYGEGKFLDTFSKVIVNSEDGSQSVELQQSGSVLPNPLGYQDLSISNGSIYVTFVKLARGTSTLTVGVDSGTVTNFTVNYTPLYRSV